MPQPERHATHLAVSFRIPQGSLPGRGDKGYSSGKGSWPFRGRRDGSWRSSPIL